jgi:hypothetical protein
MRVLFIPMPEKNGLGGLAHLIPLLSLNKMLANNPIIKTAFLTQQHLCELLRQLGVDVLDLDYQKPSAYDFRTNFRTEMMAYGKFSPDVVVDDTNIFTAFASELAKLPRITIQRTGSFPGCTPRNKNHEHSLSLDLRKMPDVTFLGLRQPASFADLFNADFKIVPGIRTIEVLPDHLRDDPSYIFSGPLLINDYLVEHIGALYSHELREPATLTQIKNFDSLQRFFDANIDRKIVYVTFGTIADPPKPIFDCISSLLDNDIAVVSSVRVDGLTAQQQLLYFYARYLPMHFVCSHVHLMVHQCGSGTYHYPIIHNVPAITIGTRCFDREDVALRLQELGCSVHIPSPEEHHDFIETFKSVADSLLNGTGEPTLKMKNNLMKVNKEIQQTSSAFVFEEVLERAVRSLKTKTGTCP